MSRLVNGNREIIVPKPENAGKLLIFCEGSTEYNYLNYFKEYLDNNLRVPYSDIVIETVNAHGNAMSVYNRAKEFLADDENSRKYLHYEKHLVFDCDAPDNIQEVITKMRESDNEYILDYSNLLIETWLVMHFQILKPNDKNNSKVNIIRSMCDFLGVQNYNSKVKAAKGTIGKILGNDGNSRIRSAIENAKILEQYWKEEGKDINNDIIQMNPSADIYKLIERIFDEIVYSCS